MGEVLKASTVEDFYEAVGTVRSKVSSVLSSKITGNIGALHVREGDRVKAGQLLIEIDDRDGNAQLRKSQSGLREAQDRVDEVDRNIQAAESAEQAVEADQVLSLSTYNRYKSLLEKKSVSQQEFDQVEARYRGRSAELERTKAQIRSLLARREQVLSKIEQAKEEVTAAQISSGMPGSISNNRSCGRQAGRGGRSGYREPPSLRLKTTLITGWRPRLRIDDRKDSAR